MGLKELFKRSETDESKFWLIGDGDLVHRIAFDFSEFSICGEYIKKGGYGEPVKMPLRSLHTIEEAELCNECKYITITKW